MALSEDQRALLRLLLAGDTYERVAEILGTAPEEVRSRARGAAEVLERQADPEFDARAVRERLDALDGAGSGGTEGAGAASATPAAATRPPRDVRRLVLWGALGLAVVVALVVVAIARHGGSGNDTAPSGGAQEEAVPVALAPVNGSRASGGITIIRVADQPAVDLAIRGLEPSRAGQTYVLWFVGSGGRSLPVAFRAVGPDGKLSGRAAIPSAATGLLPSFDTAELALVRQQQAAAALRQAAHSDTLPQAIGRVVMRGALRG